MPISFSPPENTHCDPYLPLFHKNQDHKSRLTKKASPNFSLPSTVVIAFTSEVTHPNTAYRCDP